jgi:hypothetical protein
VPHAAAIVAAVSASRSGQPKLLSPVGLIFEGEDVLDRLGAAGVGHEKGFESAAELAAAAVRNFAVVVVARGPVETVERGGDLEDLAADFEELAVENRCGVAGRKHREVLLGFTRSGRWPGGCGRVCSLVVIIPDRQPIRKL